MFNDDAQHRHTSEPGEGNAKVRLFNRFGVYKDAPFAAGVSTGSNGVGFGALAKRAKQTIDEDLDSVCVLLATGDYRCVKYSAEENGELGTGEFAKTVAKSVKAYIVAGLKRIAQGSANSGKSSSSDVGSAKRPGTGDSGKGALKKPRTGLPALADEGWLVKKGFRAREVGMQGDCFFRSVAAQLRGKNAECHGEVRRESVEWIRSHRAVFAPFFVDDGEEGGESDSRGGLDEYCVHMGEEGCYASGPVLNATAQRYNINIRILSSQQGGDYNINIAGAMHAVYLAYWHEEHYRVAERIGAVAPTAGGTIPELGLSHAHWDLKLIRDVAQSRKVNIHIEHNKGQNQHPRFELVAGATKTVTLENWCIPCSDKSSAIDLVGLMMSEYRNRVVALLRAKVTEQATRQEAHQALEKDSCQVDDCELDQVLHHLCETDVIKLDEHGTLHLLL